VNWQQAGAALEALSASLPVDRESRSGARGVLRLMPLQEGMTEGLREPLLILWASVGVVLLIACVNIASLLLARGGGRARELATRLALGCGRAGIVRQLLAESLLIGAAGATAGLLLGVAAMRALVRLAEDIFPLWNDVTLDSRVLLATAATAILTSLLFGIAPAIHFSRLDVHQTMVESGGRGHAGRARHWSQRLLVVSEVALGVVLLVSAGLLIRTFTHLRGLQPGFDPENVQTASISLQDVRYEKSDAILRLLDEGARRLRAVDGVLDAAVVLGLPYERVLNNGFHRLDGPNVNDGRNEITNLCYVTPGFFDTLRIPLRKGRLLRDSDSPGAPLAMVVNEAFVKTYLPNQEPVGSHLRTGAKDIWTIVGVVGDVQQRPGWGSFGPLAAMPLAYVTAGQFPEKAMMMVHTWFTPNWVIRTRQTQPAVLAAIQQTLASLDPLLPVAPLQPISRTQSDALRFERFLMSLLTAMAALALTLASVGLYGLISNSVQERTRELGIRMALGASLRGTVWSVLRPVAWLVAIGLAAGGVLSLFTAKVLKSLLWGVKSSDPWTFAAVGLALLGVAALASLVPTLRIVRLDPAQTLRHE
jgi:predicted permease